MAKGTNQTNFWEGEFGAAYTERNVYDPQALDGAYRKQYGISRSEMTAEFLQDLKVDNLLEVGCNVGNQLRSLQQSGYSNLYGIELQAYAVARAKELTQGINLIQGSAFDIPFRDAYFDVVGVFGVLIHIAPQDLSTALDEIFRVSKRFIWGFEDYSPEHQMVLYRGNEDRLWKGDFSRLFLERFGQLKLRKHKDYRFVENTNVDRMYLLEKT